MAFPKHHWRQLHSTNPLERLNGEIKRRTDVVAIFPNERASVRFRRRTPRPFTKTDVGELLRTVCFTPERASGLAPPADYDGCYQYCRLPALAVAIL
jgi:hypothetical protein